VVLASSAEEEGRPSGLNALAALSPRSPHQIPLHAEETALCCFLLTLMQIVFNRFCLISCNSVATNRNKMNTNTLERRSLLQELMSRGIRITGQRKILVETIQDSDRHLDAASLLELARKRDETINRATVYRTLELLKRLRLIDELDLMHLDGEKQHFYEAKTNIDHVHLACFQ